MCLLFRVYRILFKKIKKKIAEKSITNAAKSLDTRSIFFKLCL